MREGSCYLSRYRHLQGWIEPRTCGVQAGNVGNLGGMGSALERKGDGQGLKTKTSKASLKIFVRIHQRQGRGAKGGTVARDTGSR